MPVTEPRTSVSGYYLGLLAASRSYPRHLSTGSLGYLGKPGSVFESWQR